MKQEPGTPDPSGTAKSSRSWIIFLIICTIVTPIYEIVGRPSIGHIFPEGLYNSLFLASTCVAVIVGIRRNRPTWSTPWKLLAMAMGINWAAYTFDFYLNDIKHTPSFPSIADAIWFTFYIPVIASFALFSKKKGGGLNKASAIDASTIAIGMGLVSWVMSIVPYIHMEGISLLTRMASMGYPIVDIITVWFMVRLAVIPGKRHTAMTLLLVGMTLNFVADTLLGYMSLFDDLDQSYFGYLSILWFPGFAAIGAAALHPSMTSAGNKSVEATSTSTKTRVTVLAVAALIAPGLLLVEVLRGSVTDGLVIAIAAGIMFVLVLLRVADLLAQQVKTNHLLDESLRQLHQADLQLRHAQKLKSIGKLAGGLAHEINTPIQFIDSNIRFLEDAFSKLKTQNTGSTHPDREFLEAEVPLAINETLEGVARVASIVAAMKAFGNPEQANWNYSDINEILENTITVSHNEYAGFADIECVFGEIPLVECVAGDLNQVFLNVIVNASNAIADKMNGSDERGKITVVTTHENDEVLVQITDTGIGIPEDIRDHIFDPFFTTRDVGRGTGQGLSLSWTLITERHNGSIDFKSEIGVGTTFSVRLPIQKQKVTPAESPSTKSAETRFGVVTEKVIQGV